MYVHRFRGPQYMRREPVTQDRILQFSAARRNSVLREIPRQYCEANFCQI